MQSPFCIFLCHGGDFSGAFFEVGGKCKRHKTFSRYVVRKKAGRKQSNQDKTRRAQSMGSQIRRHQEERFQEEIRELLVEWWDDIATAKYIFWHCPGDNKQIFFFEGSPFNVADLDDKKASQDDDEESPFYYFLHGRRDPVSSSSDDEGDDGADGIQDGNHQRNNHHHHHQFRTIPFPTNTPTFTELTRVFTKLTSIQVQAQ
eukprot:GEZU01030906.1.p1 GENE.GEZU01030906.1~~GEZU01030906.1.p1  ORF type:complete len:202 (-),score=46.73 GEZU01030906.1:58-663(-)